MRFRDYSVSSVLKKNSIEPVFYLGFASVLVIRIFDFHDSAFITLMNTLTDNNSNPLILLRFFSVHIGKIESTA